MKTNTRRSSLLDAALNYLSEGVSVIPVDRKSKKPLVRWKTYQKRQPTIDEIRNWWKSFPDANIGIIAGKLSGLNVIDCDTEQATENFLERFPEVKDTRQVRSGRKGARHFYFLHEKGIPNDVGRILGKKIDVRAEGAFIIAPPSIHSNGTLYRQLNNKPIKSFPVALKKKLLVNKKSRATVKTFTTESEKKILLGNRNNELTSIAGLLRRRGMTPESIQKALLEENRQRCDPPLPAPEVEAIVKSISGKSAGEFENLTDTGNARRLIKRFGDVLRYCSKHRCWYAWDGKRWEIDQTGRVIRYAKNVLTEMLQTAEQEKDENKRKMLRNHALTSEAEPRIRAMIRLAESERAVAIVAEDLDQDKWLLNVENGTLNLKTGKLVPHDPTHMITKLAPVRYNPAARCPKFRKFLFDITLRKTELIDLLQRAFGYALTGDVSEQIIFFFYGTGANGKTTLLNTVSEILGDYASQAAPNILAAKTFDPHPTEIADLCGRRLVVSTEIGARKALDEALIKRITGGDDIKARRMRKDFFQFHPTHKILVATNHRPEIGGTDHAIWRRIRLVPFNKTIKDSEQDKKLSLKLRKEAPGILTWLVGGCCKWQKDGIPVPAEVQSATTEYRKDMDIVGAFLRERCLQRPDIKGKVKDVHEAYREWCRNNGESLVSARTLSNQLKERGFNNRRGTGGFYIWEGLTTKEDYQGQMNVRAYKKSQVK